jgi:hypothetical protein
MTENPYRLARDIRGIGFKTADASMSKVDRYRKEANRCAELAKEASPPFLAEIYRKVAVRYVFMAEELLKGPARDDDAIERADRMISRLQPDAGIEGIF